jgi:hypothetical protein
MTSLRNCCDSYLKIWLTRLCLDDFVLCEICCFVDEVGM